MDNTTKSINNNAEPSFDSMSRVELVTLLEKLIATEPIESLRNTVEAIKTAFYKIDAAANATNAEATETAEAVEAEVEATLSEEEIKLKALFAEYRKKRDAHLEQQEAEREMNLKIKEQIIAELKELSESDENQNHSFPKFRELQQRWRDTGSVPIQSVKDIWERYNLYSENFYSIIKINRELRDLDLRKNLEAKTALCEAAEELVKMEDKAVESFHQLQPLHDQWRETGPVEADQKEAIWQRFKDATSVINKRHADYFESLKSELEDNLKRKEEICEKIEALLNSNLEDRKGWIAASETLITLQGEWKKIGFAPKKDNTKIYNRLRTACNAFFDAKRQFFAGVKDQIDGNAARKEEICVAAEALAQSEDWRGATDAILELQSKWKTIGGVPKRQSEILWKRFRAACDTFFTRKAEHFASESGDQNENLKQKEELIATLEQMVGEAKAESIEAIKELQRKWSAIGHVPAKSREALQKRYKEVVDKLFELMRGEQRERKLGAFKERVANTIKGGANGAKGEKDKLMSKVKELNSEINQLENNLGFFARSKGAESMIASVEKKIEKAKREIAELKEKIKIVDLASRQPSAEAEAPKAETAENQTEQQ
ncbi:MAG: DUF349 domain-containing protein [Rikenellaceae bacterium]